jgi:benzodiazapine receptor
MSLMLFAAQLALNIACSWIFFGMHQPGWAFLEVVCLWLAIMATTVAFIRRSKVAGWLLVPYLAWVSFASVLNFAIWRLNLT